MHTCLVRMSNFVNRSNAETNMPGAMVLAHSLRDNGTQKKLAILVILDSLSASTLEELRVDSQVISVWIVLLTLVYRQRTTTSYLSTVLRISLLKIFIS